MTLRFFTDHCKPGCKVINRIRKAEGVVLRIGTGRDKALVQYEDGYKEWTEYYLLDFETPEP